MTGGPISGANIYGLTIRESATDGSDFTNPDADYRRLFLGEDGQLHVKDSAGAVTDIGVAGGLTVQDEGGALSTAATTLDFVGAGVTASGTGATKTITIPGGGGSALPIDAAAEAGVGSGDLFAGTSLDGGWTSLQSTALTSVDRSIDGYCILRNTGNTSSQSRGIKRTFSPAGDFTVVTKIVGATFANNYQWHGIFVGETDPSDGAGCDRLELFIVRNAGGHLKMTTIAAGAETSVFDAGVHQLASASREEVGGLQFPVWLRIKRVGSTITAGISFDGLEFIDYATTTTIAWTVNTCGLLMAETSASSDLRAAYDYIATTG